MSNFFSFLVSVLTLFIKKFPEFVDRLFKKIPDKLKEQLEPITQIVNEIKKFVDSPYADFLTSLTKTQLDDNIKEWARISLPKVLDALEVLKNGKITLPEDVTARALKLLSLNAYLTKEATGTPTDQAAITAAVYYRGSAV